MKTAFALLALLALAAAPALAKTSPIDVIHPWIAEPPGGAPTAGGYLTVKNLGKSPEVFLGGETSAADKLEIHSMSMAGGIMRMRTVGDEGVALAPGQTLVMAPKGGYHLMLIRPRHPLKAGEHVSATLKFANAGAIKVVFVVEANAMTDAMMH
jgi:copper(I)-binding protein